MKTGCDRWREGPFSFFTEQFLLFTDDPLFFTSTGAFRVRAALEEAHR